MNPKAYKTIQRKRKIKQVNAKRRARNSKRAYGDPAHRDWLHNQLCVITGNRGSRSNPMVAAHTKGDGGAGYKASARYQVPMLDSLHKELHQHGVQTFEAKYGVYLELLAAEVWGAWSAFNEDEP